MPPLLPQALVEVLVALGVTAALLVLLDGLRQAFGRPSRIGRL